MPIVARFPIFMSAAPSPSSTITGRKTLRATPSPIALAHPMEPTWYRCCPRSARVKSSRPHFPVVAMNAPVSGADSSTRSRAAKRVGRSPPVVRSSGRPPGGAAAGACSNSADATDPFFHDQGVGQTGFVHSGPGRIERRAHIGGGRGKGRMGDANIVQERTGDPAHHGVLGFVLEARLAAPGNDDQGGNAKRPVQRGKGIDRVSKTGILAHHHRPPACQPGTGRDGRGLALAGGTHVGQVRTADDPVYDRCQERARDAGIEIESGGGGRIEKVVGPNHGRFLVGAGSGASSLPRRPNRAVLGSGSLAGYSASAASAVIRASPIGGYIQWAATGFKTASRSYCQKLCMGLSCGGAILAFSIDEFDASNDLGELI